MQPHPIATKADWIAARRALLAKEKAFTRARDQLAEERRALPWIKIEKPYVFEGPAGTATLAELFDGRSQLFIKHFMMSPGATTQCVGCSFEVDHIEGILTHLNHHDVTYAVVARAPIAEIEVVRKRMGWKFPWVSSYRSDFNYDFDVSFTPGQIAAGRALYNFQKAPDWAVALEDLPGESVFSRDEDGGIYLTYSTFGRGGEDFLTAFRILDVMPKGRSETGPTRSLGDWVRPHDRYGQGGMVEPNGRYHAAGCGCRVHEHG
ncbi:MAG TPA: thioredoxin family protein [Stellaceae bacterium]|nr:thioredoxin family protein [Stellaceae bacterium]